jgi:hypothetical protein
VPIFHEKVDATDREAFLAWIREHPLGFYLNQRKSGEVMLHRGQCHHVEFNDPVRLVKTRKICSLQKAMLVTWANEEAIVVVECSDCLKAGYRD